jgi:hypothetical protein
VEALRTCPVPWQGPYCTTFLCRLAGCRGLAVHHLVIKEWQGRTMMMIASMEGHLTVYDMGPAPPGEVIRAANKRG